MCAATLSAAGPMGKGSLPPVFPKDVADKAQFDTRTRAYLSPVRVMWMQNGELIDGAQNLLSQGNGQATTAATPKTVFTAKEGKRPSILLDFGREIHGGLQFVTCIRASTKPVKVRVRLGESVGEAMCNITPENEHADVQMQKGENELIVKICRMNDDCKVAVTFTENASAPKHYMKGNSLLKP